MSLFGPPDIEKLEKKRDVNALIRALGHQKDDAVRMQAARALGRIEDSEAVEPLIAALDDKSDVVKRDASAALGKIADPRAVKPLASILGIAMWNAGGAAASALAMLGTPGIDELISALNDDDAFVRYSASAALKQVRDGRISNALVTCLSDEAAGVRENAAQALDCLGWKPEDAESEAIYSVAKEDWKSCVEIGSPAVEPLIAALRTGSPSANDDNLDSVARALGEIGDPRAVEPLLAALVGPYPHFGKCQAIAFALVKIGDPRAVAPLRTALKHSEWNVGHFAGQALEGLSSQVARTFFTDIEDRDTETRRQAAKAAFNLGAQAVDQLLTALKDADEEVRNYAALSLVSISKESDLDSDVRSRIIAHPEMRVVFEPRCAICERRIDDPEPRSIGEGLSIAYFCSDECWNRQGLIYGSPDGVGCPYYSELRMCVPPAGSSSPCSFKGVSFRYSCHVYATYKPR